ncbi:MAG TPA: hypothetical protein VN739_07165, partial [Nitrososphaerales archaeon]|nr:hypothetical protein [Nitrososphaerales archaeon]
AGLSDQKDTMSPDTWEGLPIETEDDNGSKSEKDGGQEQEEEASPIALVPPADQVMIDYVSQTFGVLKVNTDRQLEQIREQMNSIGKAIEGLSNNMKSVFAGSERNQAGGTKEPLPTQAPDNERESLPPQTDRIVSNVPDTEEFESDPDDVRKYVIPEGTPIIIRKSDGRLIQQTVTQVLDPEFEASLVKVPLGEDRKTLFGAWKRKYGYKFGVDKFLCECFDEFFANRGVQLQYIEARTAMKNSKPPSQKEQRQFRKDDSEVPYEPVGEADYEPE